MKTKIFLSGILILTLTACAWVELTEGGKKIRVLSASEVTSCKHLGQTTANVADKVGGLQRKEHIVQENLEMLARNSAAEMGGDTIVAASDIKDGKRTYRVYKCIGN